MIHSFIHLQWCRLFKWCQNLPAGHCVTVAQAVKAMLESTHQALCNSGAGCLCNVSTYLHADSLSGVGTYLLGTVSQWCRQFKRCQNLPIGHCVTVVQAVKAVSEPTCRALCYGGTVCLSNVITYLPCTVLQWCRLYKRLQDLPARLCVARVQTVKVVSEPTCWALCYSGACCLRGVRTYLPGTV